MEIKKAFGRIQNVAMDIDDYNEELIAIGVALNLGTQEELEKQYPKLHPDWEGQDVEYDEVKDKYIQEGGEDDLDTDKTDDETTE